MKKYKVNIDRQKPSPEEILSGRNFDELLKQYKAAAPGQVVKKPFWKSGWFIGSIAAAVAVVVGILIYTGNDSSEKPTNAPQIVQQPMINTTDSSAAVTNSTAPSNTFTPTKRKIAPPLPGLNVRSFAYKFKTAIGGTFTHTSGTKVTFPANAFVDANGKPVSGNIEIQYREFRDQVDFFLSGIPMQYDSAQQTYQFVSAGMMEITGFINGQPVYLAKGKTVNVEFASKETGTQYNLYKFDTLTGNWNYLGKDKVVLTPEQKLDSAALVAQTMKGPGRICGFIPDMSKPIEPVKPLKADKRKNRFTVAIDPVEFPEMKSYKDMIFEVDESNQKFDRNWYNVTWESITLSKTERQNRYIIRLAKGREKVELDVYPVFDDKSFETEIAAYELKLAGYKKQLEQYNQMLEQRKAQSAGVYNNGQGSIIKSNGDGTFTCYTDNGTEKLEKSQAIMRCFTISGFGIHNLDAIRPTPVKEIQLAIKGSDGKPFAEQASFWHADRKVCAIFGYGYVNPVNKFSFDQASSNLIWAVSDGKLFYADNDQFVKLPASGSGAITMKPVNKEFKTAEEMKRFFKISPSI